MYTIYIYIIHPSIMLIYIYIYICMYVHMSMYMYTINIYCIYIYIYVIHSIAWNVSHPQQTHLRCFPSHFGVAPGDTAGAAYIFALDGSTWKEEVG